MYLSLTQEACINKNKTEINDKTFFIVEAKLMYYMLMAIYLTHLLNPTF